MKAAKSIKGRKIEKELTDYAGRIVSFQSGNSCIIVSEWFGMASMRSNKATWNHTIIARGPRDFVQKIWDNLYA